MPEAAGSLLWLRGDHRQKARAVPAPQREINACEWDKQQSRAFLERDRDAPHQQGALEGRGWILPPWEDVRALSAQAGAEQSSISAGEWMGDRPGCLMAGLGIAWGTQAGSAWPDCSCNQAAPAASPRWLPGTKQSMRGRNSRLSEGSASNAFILSNASLPGAHC